MGLLLNYKKKKYLLLIHLYSLPLIITTIVI